MREMKVAAVWNERRGRRRQLCGMKEDEEIVCRVGGSKWSILGFVLYF